jgi:hypothetical protein
MRAAAVSLSLAACMAAADARAVGEPVQCDGAPPEAVLRLRAPLNQWALVFCSPNGHVIAPVDGFVWLTAKNRPFFFTALAAEGHPVKGRHQAYFVAQAQEKLAGDEVEKARKLFEIEFGRGTDASDVYQLDVVTLGGLRYNLFFYLKDATLRHVIGCIDACKQSVGLRSMTFEEAQRDANRPR